MLLYCKKCGKVFHTISTNEKCPFCGLQTSPVPKEYWEDDNGIFLSNQTKEKIVEELVKNSPNFNQNAFDGRIEKEKESDKEWQRVQSIIDTRSNQSKNQPKCPTCGSTNIKKVSGVERGTSVAFFGLFSKKIGKQFKCNSCGYMW